MKELIRDKHYYFNEAGLVVFTKEYHLERGYCCGSGCLHCPYTKESHNTKGSCAPATGNDQLKEQ